jgi:ribosomal protein L37AE/L43A
MSTKYQAIEIWWCSKCDREWKAPAVPHNPKCPACGTGGWWRRFATSEDLGRKSDHASK